jgi:D-alanine-D-alanine ligase-like ATP-grasp enzyme
MWRGSRQISLASANSMMLTWLSNSTNRNATSLTTMESGQWEEKELLTVAMASENK